MLPLYIPLCYANDTDLDYTLAFEDMPRKYEGTKKTDFHSHTFAQHTHTHTHTHRNCWQSLILAWILLEGRKISQTFHLGKHLLF